MISSDNPDIGEVKEEIEAQVSGEEVSVGFNPKYVVDILSQISTETVSVEIGGELDPVVIRPTGELDRSACSRLKVHRLSQSRSREP